MRLSQVKIQNLLPSKTRRLSLPVTEGEKVPAGGAMTVSMTVSLPPVTSRVCLAILG